MAGRYSSLARILVAGIAAGVCALWVPAAFAQQPQDAPAKSSSDKPAPAKPPKSVPPDLVTIHIEVTGGEKEKPVESASVYIRYYEPRKIKADKLIEMNVKTSAEGNVRVTLVPKGRILIQVVAEGWKTFGRWFDLTEDGQVFKIHLDRPHKWY